ncbi:MAG TPA: hypothetical protein VGW75_11705 [Solirubrobacteraceae bacterium]|jgi:hypothetical protein|nr:hypothetical protein [Solirubrobacteraceae bacterium]
MPWFLRRGYAPSRKASNWVRVVAAPAAVAAVALAVLGTDGLHKEVGELVLRIEVGDRSPDEGDVRAWGRLALVAVAAAAVLVRGLWADVLVGVCVVLVWAALVGYGQDVSEVARLSASEAKVKARADAAKAKVAADAKKRKTGPLDVTGANTRFSLPPEKLRAPGEDLERGAVKVVFVVPERADDEAILRREARAYDATLRIDVPAAGTEKAVPVDVTDAAMGAFAADLSSAEAIYLVGGSQSPG